MSVPEPDFSLAAYGRLLEALGARGYRSVRFAEGDPAARHLILRHDVDMDLAAAVDLAEFERGSGQRATYFVLVRSELYNPASRAGTEAVRRLIALGHEVGLHFDAALYDDDLELLTEGAERERRVLETISGRPVEMLSLHRPNPALLGNGFAPPGLINAYAPRFFEEFGYVSDSRGGWHHGHPLDHPAGAEGRGLHLLTHPIWWTGGGETAQNKLDKFFEGGYQLLIYEAAADWLRTAIRAAQKDHLRKGGNESRRPGRRDRHRVLG